MLSKRDLLVAAGAAAFASASTLAVVAGAPDPAKPIMRSSVFQWDAFKAEPTPAGSRRQCLDARTLTLDRLESHVTTLNPGQSPPPPHKHPEEELVIVKEGVVESLQNDRTTRVSA